MAKWHLLPTHLQEEAMQSLECGAREGREVGRSCALQNVSHLLREDSEVFKMLQENREARMAPRQSSSFRLLQEALEAEERGEPLGARAGGHSPRTL